MCNDVHLPSIEAIKAGIVENLQVGKKVFMLGTSIARDIEKALKPLCASKGIVTFAITRGGHFLNKWNDIDMSCLQSATRQDKLFIYWLGNELLNCKSVDIDDSMDNVPVYHPNGAVVLEDIAMDRLVAISGKKLRCLAKAFPGHIYFFGPGPRYISKCCDDVNHIIKGPNNEVIDMMTYTTVFSSFIERSPGIVQERISYIHYQDIFGNSFNNKMLTDGVHMTDAANNTIAEFIIAKIDEEPLFTAPLLIDTDFSDYLRSNKVIDDFKGFVQQKDPDGGAHSLDDDDDMNIDTAIHLAGFSN